MEVRVRAFDWRVYTEEVMPAFARWLVDKDETLLHELFEGTRCAIEEQFLPAAMQKLRVWPRAKQFVDALPRGPHSRKEYVKLSSAEEFTLLSDRYLHNHVPHLYQDSAALRTIWGAIVEEYCLVWFRVVYDGYDPHAQVDEEGMPEPTVRSELILLLQEAGLPELAHEVGEETTEVERFEWEHDGESSDTEPVEEHEEEPDIYADEEQVDEIKPRGVILGQQRNVLHLRGWLASVSVRAMALFEYLVCGRRRMPFGYEAGEPFGGYIGYLTPNEVWQLSRCLRNVKPPSQLEAQADDLRFREQQTSERLVDEVLPTNAGMFLDFLQGAALQGLGLIGSVE